MTKALSPIVKYIVRQTTQDVAMDQLPVPSVNHYAVLDDAQHCALLCKEGHYVISYEIFGVLSMGKWVRVDYWNMPTGMMQTVMDRAGARERFEGRPVRRGSES